jgi:hypothetical protein
MLAEQEEVARHAREKEQAEQEKQQLQARLKAEEEARRAAEKMAQVRTCMAMSFLLIHICIPCM